MASRSTATWLARGRAGVRPGRGTAPEDDFLLHIAPFPIFVVPPEAWEGLVALGGHGGRGGYGSCVPTRIQFEYLDRAGEPTRGLHVVSVDAKEEDHLEKLYPAHREQGVWWFVAGDDAAYLPQLSGRFGNAPNRALERRRRLARGRRYLGQGRLTVSGTETLFERFGAKPWVERTSRARSPLPLVREG